MLQPALIGPACLGTKGLRRHQARSTQPPAQAGKYVLCPTGRPPGRLEQRCEEAWHGPAVITATLAWLSVMNVALAFFNLLLSAPLDGGRILRGLLWKRYGDR